MGLIKKIGLVSVGLLSIGIFSDSDDISEPVEKKNYTEFDVKKVVDNDETEVEESVISEPLLVCDGTNITVNCELDGIVYELYVYHPAVSEKSHYEEALNGYTQVVVGYCTMCNDGTRSPSCSTGSGTCSHHGGVKEFNAPIYESVPNYETKKVIDIPAADAWYETIVK